MRLSQRFIAVLLASACIAPLFGQMAGNPAGSRGEGEWTVALLGNYFRMHQDRVSSTSKRVLLKSGWGLTSWLDAGILVGGVQLEMGSPLTNVEDFKGKAKFAFGLGFQSQFPLGMTDGSPSFWIGGQALRFTSHGSFFERNEFVTHEFVMDYDWREFQLHAGLIFPMRFLRIYAAGAGWAVQRLDSKEEYLLYGGTQQHVGEEEGEYRSGIWTGGIAGIEFLLPGRYSVGIEMLYFNSHNYQIMVGLSQTGMLGL